MLTKCCLLEKHIEVDDGRVVVPWGASLSQVSEALAALAAEWEPRGHPPERLRALRPPVDHARAGRRVRRAGAAADAGWTSWRRWRGRRRGWASSPPRRPRRSPRMRARGLLDLDLVAERDPAHLALDARPDPRLCSRSCPRARGSTCTSARPSRTSPTPGSAWSCATSGLWCWRDLRAIEDTLLDAGRRAPRHRDGRPDARAARCADHVRLQGRLLGRRGPPPSGAARARAARGGWSASSPARSACWASSRRSGAALRAAFCAELGLADPGISWLTTRDRIAEFGACWR